MIGKNFFDELKEIEKILEESKTVKNREPYEKLLEAITEGEDMQKVIEELRVNGVSLLSFDQSAFLIQRISEGIYKKEHKAFIKKYNLFFKENKNIKEYKEFLKTAVSAEKVLLHLLNLLQEFLAGKKYTNLALSLGDRLYKAPSQKEVRSKKGKTPVELVKWDENVIKLRLRVVDSILRIGEETLGLYVVRDFPKGRELTFTPEFYKCLEENYLMTYKEFPMLVEPLDWKKNGLGGGYLRKKDSCIQSKPEIKLEFQENVSNNIAIESLNSLQKVKWKVNEKLVDLLLEIYNNGSFSLGKDLIVKKEKELLFSTDHFLSSEELDAIYEQNKSFVLRDRLNDPNSSIWWIYKNYRSRKAAYAFFYLNFLKTFSKIDYFFFVHFLDGRGRIYPKGLFSYQNSELVRACLEFYKEEEVLIENNWSTLCEYGAALYGIKENAETFIKTHENHWKTEFNWEFIRKAKKPILFLAFCLEYRKWASALFEGKKIVKSSLPLYIDAGSNALQHYTAIGGLTSFVSEVNMGKKGGDKDFYTKVSERIKNKMSFYLSNRLEAITSGSEPRKRLMEPEFLLYLINNQDLYFNRKILKTPLMSFGYGVSPYGISEQLIEKFKEEPVFQPFLSLNYEPMFLNFLSEPLHKFLEEEMSEVQQIQDIFKSWVEKALKKNPDQSFEWNTGIGLNLSIAYPIKKIHKIKFTNRAKSKFNQTFVVRIPEFPLDKRHMKQSFPANFVHSLDAVNIHLVIGKLFKEKSGEFCLASIHDSLGITFNSVSQAKILFKSSFIEIYEDKIDLFFKYLLKINEINDLEEQKILQKWKETRQKINWKDLLENDTFIKF